MLARRLLAGNIRNNTAIRPPRAEFVATFRSAPIIMNATNEPANASLLIPGAFGGSEFMLDVVDTTVGVFGSVMIF